MTIPDSYTDPMFLALASALASIEAGVIDEAEVESRRITGHETETILTIIVRRTDGVALEPDE